MNGNKKHAYICQQYLSTNNCPIGEICILKHIGKNDTIYSSSQAEKGRTFTVLPFTESREQINSKSLPNSNQSKLSNSNNTKSPSPGQYEESSNDTNIKHKNTNNLHEVFPKLTKSQKKRNRRKGKSNRNDETQDNRINDKNLCAKPKSECEEHCESLHGDICDLCSRPVLHPLNAQYRREHSEQCVEKHEEITKEELAISRSMDRQCDICFEAVMQKKGDHRFAILPDCNHCFCLVCIKIWRKSDGFGKSIRKSCPQCRVVSHYVCPNKYWVENKEDKAEVILKYKCTLAKIDCKYFAKNERCQFGNKCFYKHCKKDGTPVDLGAPWKNRTPGSHLFRQREFTMDALFDIMMNDDSDGSDDSLPDYHYENELSENSYEDLMGDVFGVDDFW